ncbi:MAG: tyrosine-protein phosphatase [Candidatus Binatia bacterium]|nr:tyrosine-protein phosphatase [Candidatus Binatia bacterium]
MQRVIDLEGCLNFRDLGGYPTDDGRRVRWRRAFRADGLHLLTPSDVDRIRDELEIRDVIDLRSTAERRADVGRPLDAVDEIQVHHTPLFDGDMSNRRDSRGADLNLSDRYVALAGLAKKPIAQALQVIAGSTGSAVYHCAAGKDRTGVVSALLLGVLGVRNDVIVADYAATKENLDRIIDRLTNTPGYETIHGELPPETLHAEPETMIGFLDGIEREYGSVADYARAAGVPAQGIDTLRAELLEDA